MKYVEMILICLAVGTALPAVLYFFFRRLNKIELDRWGDKAKADTQESMRGSFARMFRKRKKV